MTTQKSETPVLEALMDITEQRHAMYETLTTTLFELLRPLTDGVLQYLDFNESQIEWVDISPLEDSIVLHGMWMNHLTPTKLVIGFPLELVEQQSSKAVLEYLQSIPVTGYLQDKEGSQTSIPIEDPTDMIGSIQHAIDDIRQDEKVTRTSLVPEGETVIQYAQRQASSKRTIH